MTDYSSATPQNFNVNDLTGGPVYTNGFVNTGGNGTFSSPYSWQAASTTVSTGHFTLHYWRSGSTNNWGHVSRSDITTSVSGTTITVKLNNVDQFTFTESGAFAPSGPTVTSHYYVNLTENAKVLTSDTVQSSDFAFLKGTSSYTPNSMNLVAISGGYVYDYQHTTTDMYTATIDSQPVSHFYYDNSWTSSPTSYTGRTSNSTRILNVLGKIPSTSSMTYSTTIWNAAAPTRSSDDRLLSVRFYKIGSNAYPATELFVYFYVFGNQNDIKAKFAGYRYEGTTLLDYEMSNEFTIGAQEWMSYTFSDDGHDQIVEIKDWVYSDEPEGSGYVAPVSTTSNGGGKPDRYPLIMTNLFNRNRSLYSIGMTHKDTWDLFL